MREGKTSHGEGKSEAGGREMPCREEIKRLRAIVSRNKARIPQTPERHLKVVAKKTWGGGRTWGGEKDNVRGGGISSQMKEKKKLRTLKVV